MKHNVLILTAALLLHTVVYAGNPNTLIRNAAANPSPITLQTLCQQLQGQPLSDLSDSTAGTQFANTYGRPLTQACSATAMAELAQLITNANAYSSLAPAGGVGPTTPASDTAAENFLESMANYIAVGGSTEIYSDLFAQAKVQFTAATAATAAAAARGAAPSPITAAVETLATKFQDPATGALYVGGDATKNLQFVNDVSAGFRTLATTGGRALGRNNFDVLNWLNTINTQLADYNATINIGPAVWSMNGFTYDINNNLEDNVRDLITHDNNRITAAGGGAGGVCNTAVTAFANKFATPGDVGSTINSIDQFFQRFQDNNIILQQLNTRTLDASCNLLYNAATQNANLVLAEDQKVNLSNYLQQCSTAGVNQIANFIFDPATELGNIDSLTRIVRRLRQQIEINLRGAAPAPAPAPAPSAAELTAFNNTVAAHNAAITALDINATRGFFITAGSTARQNFLGKPYPSNLTQCTDAAYFAPSIIVIYTGLAANAANLYKTQQALAPNAPAGTVFTAIQTLVNNNATVADATLAATPTVFTTADITAPTLPTPATFTAGTFNVFMKDYPTT